MNLETKNSGSIKWIDADAGGTAEAGRIERTDQRAYEELGDTVYGQCTTGRVGQCTESSVRGEEAL